MNPARRKAVIRAWERRMRTELRHPVLGYSVSYRRAVELQAPVALAHGFQIGKNGHAGGGTEWDRSFRRLVAGGGGSIVGSG
jgi:hypothetical protein